MFLVHQVLRLQKTQQPVIVEQVNTGQTGTAHFVLKTLLVTWAPHPVTNVLETQPPPPDQTFVIVLQECPGQITTAQLVRQTPTA